MNTLKLLLIALLAFVVKPVLSQDMRHSTVMLSLMCPKEEDLDKEKALVTYNPTTHVMRLTTDIFEAIDTKPAMDTTFSEEVDGMPLSLEVKIDVPEIDFKSSKNNGEQYTFNTLVSCNGKEQTIPVNYVFIFAPVVGQTATAVNFRLGFVLSFNPMDFGFYLHGDCTEVVIKMQDAWLNRTTQ